MASSASPPRRRRWPFLLQWRAASTEPESRVGHTKVRNSDQLRINPHNPSIGFH